jgi:hypothetical protein
MTPPRRWAVAALVATFMAADTALVLAQNPPAQGQAKGGAREKAAGKRPARRRPKGNAPVGLIVPYPFPPALIIRQTPEAHDEVQAFLNMLRYR